MKDFGSNLIEVATPPADGQSIRLDDNPVLLRKAIKRRQVELTKVSQAARQIGSLPRKGEALHARMDGSFDGYDLIPALLELIAPERIEHLLIATLSYNRRNGERLMELIDAGQVKQCDFLCSEMFAGKERESVHWLESELKRRGARLFFARNHCKLILARTSRGRHLVIEGSQNLRTCRCYEQLVMSDDRKLFEFHQRFIESFREDKDEARKKAKAGEGQAAGRQSRKAPPADDRGGAGKGR